MSSDEDQQAVLLRLTRAEALLFFEWLARVAAGEVPTEDPAEEQVFWKLEAQLESALVDPFRPDYVELVETARKEVRGSQANDHQGLGHGEQARIGEAHWHAEVTNDPSRDYALCVEIFDGRVHRATVERAQSGELVMTWFASQTEVKPPASWLVAILQRAEADLPRP